MVATAPPKSQEICRKLLSGYQFSESDLYDPATETLYTTLEQQFDQFQHYLEVVGFSLVRDDGVILLEKGDKVLSNEEKQAIVALFLLVDLWLEKGKSYNDLFQLSIPWTELDWFRDGYGKEYLAQVGISANDDLALEDLFRRLQRKGVVNYNVDTRTVTLRKPAERLYNMARKIHQQLKPKETIANE
jgi:hypothetical protein